VAGEREVSGHLAFGLATQALLLASIAFALATRLPLPQRRLAAAAAAALALIPLADGISAAMALRALWGDPSVTTLQLLALSLAGRPAKISRAPAAAVALFGIVFYVLALGLGDFDPYRLGYPGWPALALAAGLAVAALLAWRRGQPLYAWLLAVDLAVFSAGLPESANLWDSLFDPLLVAAALVLAVRGTRR
jgi:hypothetical protein